MKTTAQRPLLKLQFRPINEPVSLRGDREWVFIYPLSQRVNRWRILEQLIAFRDQTVDDKEGDSL
ncbi:MAG: hypothetical protein QXH03_10290 [Candidatus Bathyarchaeia archaeon]